MHILAEIVAYRAGEHCHGRRHGVEPLQHKRQGFAHVADHDLKFWVLIKNPTENQADNMNRGLDVPTPSGTREHVRDNPREPGVRRLDHRLGRLSGVEVNRHLEPFRALENRPEESVVEIASPVMAVDHSPFETVLTNHPFQLFSGLVRISGRQSGKPGKARWIFLDGAGKKVVSFAGKRYGVRAFNLLGTWRSE